MIKDTKTTVEQRLSELLNKECRDWTLAGNKQIVLSCDEEIEEIVDDDLYNKIVADIETVFSEEIKSGKISCREGFLYGRSVRITVCLNDDIPQYFLRFYQNPGELKKKSNLADLRKKASMSQAQLAISAGVSVATIRNYEQNPDSVNTAQYQTLCTLSQVLGCEIKDIMSSGIMAYSLEELYPDDKMSEAVRIIKDYINEKADNKCIFVTGTIGSGVTTVTRCLANYIKGGTVIGDSLVLQDTRAENRDILCIRLKTETGSKHIIKSITLVNTYKNEVLWEYSGE